MPDYSGLKPHNTPIVTVHWSDIVSEDNWGQDDEVTQPIECVTVGWLLEETPTMIIVGSSYDFREDRWGSKHAFPKNPPEISTVKEGRDE